MNTPAEPAPAATPPRLSIVVPALNEADNLRPLVEQVEASIIREGVYAELIVVDDGSSDDTAAVLAALMKRYTWVRGLRHELPLGQSRAMFDGIHAARGQFIATLDADLQNDPADLPAMLRLIESGQADLVQGDRSRNRRDNWIRRRTSGIGRAFRRMLLGDRVRDTGCSARVMKADTARRLPLMFKGMHRFIPAHAALQGATIAELAVNHRPRMAGTTKYGLGMFSRAWPGLMDCFAMRWMQKRYRAGAVTPMRPEASR